MLRGAPKVFISMYRMLCGDVKVLIAQLFLMSHGLVIVSHSQAHTRSIHASHGVVWTYYSDMVILNLKTWLSSNAYMLLVRHFIFTVSMWMIARVVTSDRSCVCEYECVHMQMQVWCWVMCVRVICGLLVHAMVVRSARCDDCFCLCSSLWVYI